MSRGSFRNPFYRADNLSFGKKRLAAVRVAEEAGMKSYFLNVYADFLCCEDIDDLLYVAGSFARYKLNTIVRPETLRAEREAVLAGKRTGRSIDQIDRELTVSEAYAAGGVFEMLDKLRALYTSLYDQLNRPPSDG